MKFAPKFIRFNEINKSKIHCDFHIHTNQTDGDSSIEEYIERAIELGLKEIAFTEHVRKSSKWYNSFTERVQRIRKNFADKLNIFYGIEAKVLDLDGNIDAEAEMISNSEIVVGSVHRYPNGKNRYFNFKDLSVEDAAKMEFEFACALLKNPSVNILGHPGGVFERQFQKDFPNNFYMEIIKKANYFNKVIEINSRYLKNPKDFFKLCKMFNPLISFGSDAHNVEELGNIVKIINKNL